MVEHETGHPLADRRLAVELGAALLVHPGLGVVEEEPAVAGDVHGDGDDDQRQSGGDAGLQHGPERAAVGSTPAHLGPQHQHHGEGQHRRSRPLRPDGQPEGHAGQPQLGSGRQVAAGHGGLRPLPVVPEQEEQAERHEQRQGGVEHGDAARRDGHAVDRDEERGRGGEPPVAQEQQAGPVGGEHRQRPGHRRPDAPAHRVEAEDGDAGGQHPLADGRVRRTLDLDAPLDVGVGVVGVVALVELDAVDVAEVDHAQQGSDGDDRERDGHGEPGAAGGHGQSEKRNRGANGPRSNGVASGSG